MRSQTALEAQRTGLVLSIVVDKLYAYRVPTYRQIVISGDRIFLKNFGS